MGTVAHLWLVPQDDGPTVNIIATIVVGLGLLLRVPVVRRWIVLQRRRRGGSLLRLRAWLTSTQGTALN